MKKMYTLLLVAAFSFVFTQAEAQEKSSHYKAAEELLLNMKADKFSDDAINNMQNQIKANPFIQPNTESIGVFLKKYMGWEALREDIINIYMTEFKESELKDISAFYLTPSGKKLAEKQTDIMVKMMQVGQKKIQAHMGEMMNMMPKENKSAI